MSRLVYIPADCIGDYFDECFRPKAKEGLTLKEIEPRIFIVSTTTETHKEPVEKYGPYPYWYPRPFDHGRFYREGCLCLSRENLIKLLKVDNYSQVIFSNNCVYTDGEPTIVLYAEKGTIAKPFATMRSALEEIIDYLNDKYVYIGAHREEIIGNTRRKLLHFPYARNVETENTPRLDVPKYRVFSSSVDSMKTALDRIPVDRATFVFYKRMRPITGMTAVYNGTQRIHQFVSPIPITSSISIEKSEPKEIPIEVLRRMTDVFEKYICVYQTHENHKVAITDKHHKLWLVIN